MCTDTLHASDKKHFSFKNIDTYPNIKMKPLKIAMAMVNVENSPGIICNAINVENKKKKKKIYIF